MKLVAAHHPGMTPVVCIGRIRTSKPSVSHQKPGSAMANGYEKSPDYGGPEPSRAWLWFMAILGVIVLFGVEYFRR